MDSNKKRHDEVQEREAYFLNAFGITGNTEGLFEDKSDSEVKLGHLQEKLRGVGLTDEEIDKLIEPIRDELNKRVCGLVWQKQTSSIPKGFDGSLPYFEHQTDRDIVGNGDNNHLLIEGDNLFALLGMQYTHIDPNTKKGMINCIYIDPPYGTGNVTFGYNDKFEKSEWLSMMDIRLKLAKNLLTDDGLIFISIDDNFLYELKLLCDQIFNTENYITTICVEISKTQGMKVKAAQDGKIVKNHEYVLVYAKSNRAITQKRMPLYEGATKYDSHYSVVLDKNLNKCSLIDVLKHDSFASSLFSKYDMKVNIDNIEKLMQIDKEFEQYILDHADSIYLQTICKINVPDDVLQDLRDGKIVRYKDYLLYLTSGGQVFQYISFKNSLHTTDDYIPVFGRATIRGALWKGFYSDMINVSKEGGVEFKNGKKPVRLIKQLLKWANVKNATVLDFYAGSGTTGQAVLDLNAEDGGNRHFILCTNNEIYDPNLRKKVDEKLHPEMGVCQRVTYPRMKNVFANYPNDSLRYMKINTDIKETGLNDADIRSVIDEFVSYIKIKENTYDSVRRDTSYMLTNETKGVLVLSTDENDSLIPYLKAKRIAKQQFTDDGKKHIVYCSGIGREAVVDGIHYMPYPEQVLNRIKAVLHEPHQR